MWKRSLVLDGILLCRIGTPMSLGFGVRVLLPSAVINVFGLRGSVAMRRRCWAYSKITRGGIGWLECGFDFIARAADGAAAAIEHVAVDHRRAHIGVSEKLLHGANVVAVLNQSGGEGM